MEASTKIADATALVLIEVCPIEFWLIVLCVAAVEMLIRTLQW
jgi:hypothetical protein